MKKNELMHLAIAGLLSLTGVALLNRHDPATVVGTAQAAAATVPVGPLPTRVETLVLPASVATPAPAQRLDPPPAPAPIVGGLGNAEGWHDLAISAGWSEQKWPWVLCVIRRESNGDPMAYNYNRKTKDNSWGLMQLNIWGSLWGWYQDHGITEPKQLFDPYTNLATAVQLHSEHPDAWGRCNGDY